MVQVSLSRCLPPPDPPPASLAADCGEGLRFPPTASRAPLPPLRVQVEAKSCFGIELSPAHDQYGKHGEAVMTLERPGFTEKMCCKFY